VEEKHRKRPVDGDLTAFTGKGIRKGVGLGLKRNEFACKFQGTL